MAANRLMQLKKFHKSFLAEKRCCLHEGDFDFANAIKRARFQRSERTFCEGGRREALVEGTDWGREGELGLLRDETRAKVEEGGRW